MIVIADTGPLNYLVLIGAVEVLPSLFGRIVIPSAVMMELKRTQAPALVKAWVADPPLWLEIRSAPQTGLTQLAYLGAGEREAILLAEEMHPDWLIMDDRQGRQEAARRHLPVMGTLRVLDEAALRGLIDLPAVIARLEQTTFHLSPDLKQWLMGRHVPRGIDSNVKDE